MIGPLKLLASKFRQLARELGGDGDGAVFEETVKQIPVVAPSEAETKVTGEIGSALRHESLEEYVDFLSIIILSAPSNFNNFDFPPPYQTNFEVAFRLAREGMALVEARTQDTEVLARLNGKIEEAYQAFSSFDPEGKRKGSKIMQEFRSELVAAVRRKPRRLI